MIRLLLQEKCDMNLDSEADPSLGEVDLLILYDGGLASALQLRIEPQHHVEYYLINPMCDTTILRCETQLTELPPLLTWPRGPGIGFQISNVTECCSRVWGDDTVNLSACHHNKTLDDQRGKMKNMRHILSIFFILVGSFLFSYCWTKIFSAVYVTCKQQIFLTLTHYSVWRP